MDVHVAFYRLVIMGGLRLDDGKLARDLGQCCFVIFRHTHSCYRALAKKAQISEVAYIG